MILFFDRNKILRKSTAPYKKTYYPQIDHLKSICKLAVCLKKNSQIPTLAMEDLKKGVVNAKTAFLRISNENLK